MATSKSSYLDYFSHLPSYIVYSNDTEYRECVRKVFQFNPLEKYNYNGKLCHFNDLDPVTQDELMYDSKTVETHMDELFDLTKDCVHFRELYLYAAGRMFSTEHKIGQAVLCSYDTFHYYYSCIWYYLHGGSSSLLSCKEYQQLKSYYQI